MTTGASSVIAETNEASQGTQIGIKLFAKKGADYPIDTGAYDIAF